LKEKEYYIYKERYDWLTDPRRFEKIFHKFRARVFLKKFNNAIKNFSYVDWVLDAGCGTGLITYQLKKPVVCLDINAWNLTRVKNRLRDYETVQADIERLPFRDGCFEIIISTEVLEHVPNPAKAVKEIKRVLGDGGLFMGTVPSIHPVWRLRRIS